MRKWQTMVAQFVTRVKEQFVADLIQLSGRSDLQCEKAIEI